MDPDDATSQRTIYWRCLAIAPAVNRRSGGQFVLAWKRLCITKSCMKNNEAFEHLQVIRTIMERSALYRRALAPVMTFAGVLGLVAAATGWWVGIDSVRGFVGFWLLVGMGGSTVALLLVRRQALRAAESFWSPPTRRIAQAALPALLAGLALGVFFWVWIDDELVTFLYVLWPILYGCALHSAGFFTSRGLRALGWIYILAGLGLLFAMAVLEQAPQGRQCHLVMGAFFGALQLAYGIYLYFTERPSVQP